MTLVAGNREARVPTPSSFGCHRALSNANIAERLVISPLTAKTHVARILTKLNCHDRAQLVAPAYETGFVTPGAHSEGVASDAA